MGTMTWKRFLGRIALLTLPVSLLITSGVLYLGIEGENQREFSGDIVYTAWFLLQTFGAIFAVLMLVGTVVGGLWLSVFKRLRQ